MHKFLFIASAILLLGCASPKNTVFVNDELSYDVLQGWVAIPDEDIFKIEGTNTLGWHPPGSKEASIMITWSALPSNITSEEYFEEISRLLADDDDAYSNSKFQINGIFIKERIYMVNVGRAVYREQNYNFIRGKSVYKIALAGTEQDVYKYWGEFDKSLHSLKFVSIRVSEDPFSLPAMPEDRKSSNTQPNHVVVVTRVGET